MTPAEQTPCWSCGKTVASDAQFCRACGARIEDRPTEARAESTPRPSTCPNCGEAAPATARHCRRCGSALTEENLEPPPSATAKLPPSPVFSPGASPTEGFRGAEGGPDGVRERLGRVDLPRRLLIGMVIAVLVLGGSALAVAQFGGGDSPEQPNSGGGSSDAGGDGSANDGSTSSSTAQEGGSIQSGALPDESQATMESEIQSMLLDFHRAIVEGRFKTAWQLLSRRKQQRVRREDGYAAWREAQATLNPYLDPEGLEVRIDNLSRSDGAARVEVTGMSWSKPGANCSEWSGRTWAKYEDGQWRYEPGYSTTRARERVWKDRYSELLGGSCQG